MRRAIRGILHGSAAITFGVVAVAAGTRHSATNASSECAERRSIHAAGDSATDFRLLLNVPAFRLDVIDRDTVARSISVAVGQPRYRTPLGHFQMDYVIWNPWWRPPNSEWARKERVTPPGWKNPVGRVKLHMTGLVFLHGTPLEASRGSAASHACVRMSNADAIALARLVHERAGPPLSPALLDSLVDDTSRTQTVTLDRTVPIDVVYRLAEVRGDDLAVYPDVYQLANTPSRVERHVVDALVRAGMDTTRLSRERVRVLVRASRRVATHTLVTDVLGPP